VRTRFRRQRTTIVILHELEDLDTAQISTLLGISRITVRWHLARAHRELARLVTSKGHAHARR
jgi:DNA-directed RNA polymerase specialized sigma24 family protein